MRVTPPFLVCSIQGTSGSRGGAHPARAPPNGSGPKIFLCPKRLFFTIFSSLASLAINFKHNFNRNMAQNTLKYDFYSPPPPVDKVHAPPKVKSWIRHCRGYLDGTQYAKGRYAVRKNYVISYAYINFYFKKVQFSLKKQHM